MAKAYKGTKITGTSTTAKVFAGSGVKSANVGDTYLNTDKGHNYKCTTAGDAAHAKWKYTSTSIIKKPIVPVKSLTLTRNSGGSRVLTGTWKVQDAMVSKTRGDRATGLRFRWYFDTSVKGKKNIIDKESTGNEKATTRAENLAGFVANGGKKNVSYNRQSFYPYAGKPKLLSVTLAVDPYNTKGDGSWKSVAQSKTYTFGEPRKPAISNPSFNTENGTVSATIDTDPGEDARERLWTRYEVVVTDLSKSGSQRVRVTSSGTSTSTSFNLSYDATNYQSLTSDQYIQVEFRARAEGFAGDSGWATRTYFVSFPKPVSILTSDASHVTATSRDSSGKVVVPISVSRPEGFPVDTVKLQQLVNVTYASPSTIPGDAAWTDTGATDDGDCTALVGSVAEMLPDAGKHSWVRVKAWHANEAALFSYSNIVEVPLFTPAASAADNVCSITKKTPGDDGESIECVVAWDLKSYSGDEDTTGIELSWSDYENAWKSTESPKVHEFEWHDASVDPSASSLWNKSATITIRGLSEGVTYYIRARCYTDDENGVRSYGEYCNVASCQTASTPPSVVLSAPAAVAEGDGIPFTWIFSSTSPQKSWQLFRRRYVKTTDAAIVTGKTYYTLSNGVYTAVANPSAGSLSSYYEAFDDVLAGGNGETGAYVLDSARVAKFASGGSLTCQVRCSTGGEFVESSAVAVNIAAYPTLAVSASTLTAQPFAFGITSSVPSVSLAYVVSAADSGVTGCPETLRETQPAGDVIATGVVVPETTAVTSGSVTTYTATITLDSGLDFRDGGTYQVSAVATDTASGLASAEAVAKFAVAWSHQAPVPALGSYVLTSDEAVDDNHTYFVLEDDEYVVVENPVDADLDTYYEFVGGITITPIEQPDANGDMTRACAIALVAPSGAASGDYYDLYRVTHDGADLIGSKLALDSTWTDLHAPFGDAGDYGYRVACRTADGDEEWCDFGYYLGASCLRFDFGLSSVELPYNIVIQDGYEKDVEVRTHMDGSSEAYFNAGVSRKATLTTSVIRIEDAVTASRVRELAQHRGTAFVRTPDGSAYEAHVDVPTLDVGYGVITAKFDAVRVDTSAAFMLPVNDEITSTTTTTTTTGE